MGEDYTCHCMCWLIEEDAWRKIPRGTWKRDSIPLALILSVELLFLSTGTVLPFHLFGFILWGLGVEHGFKGCVYQGGLFL